MTQSSGIGFFRKSQQFSSTPQQFSRKAQQLSRESQQFSTKPQQHISVCSHRYTYIHMYMHVSMRTCMPTCTLALDLVTYLFKQDCVWLYLSTMCTCVRHRSLGTHCSSLGNQSSSLGNRSNSMRHGFNNTPPLITQPTPLMGGSLGWIENLIFSIRD